VRVPNRHPSGHRSGSHFLALGVLAVVTSAAPGVLRAAPAAGDAPFDGKWRQGPLREDFTVQQWLPGCGPAPVSGTQGGGEIVSIHQEGDELSIVGGGRVYRTNQCYDQLPTLAREAHSRDPSGRTWRTRCTTPAADPRRAMMQTLVSATNDTHIDVVETGRYEISLAEGRCIADVKRSRDYDLVTRDSAQPVTVTPPAPAPNATTTPPSPPRGTACASPGPPARLEVRPSRKLLRTGESFAFHAVVTDASGCVTTTPTPIGWAIGAPLSVDTGGKVTVPEGTAEGTSTLVATAAGKSVRVTVDVTAPSHYDELLARSGLNAAGESESASVAELATGAIAGGDARATDTSRARRLTFITIVGLLALALGIVAIVFGRKARRAARLEADADERHAELVREAEARHREKEAMHAEQVRAHHESVEVHRRASEAAAAMEAEATDGGATGDPDARTVCPACRREYPSGSLFCPDDASRLVALRAGDDVAASGGICPSCHRGFDPGVKVCPHDGEELVPSAMHAAAATRAPSPPGASRGKICPTCGGRFEGSAAFCGKDGTALVMIN
jgi:hypothetical protein